MVIGLSVTAFTIFVSTKDLEPIDGLNPWARPTKLWPQILTLVVACLSFLASAIVILSYLRGHKNAERRAYLTTIATVLGMIVWLALWIAAGASLRRVKVTANRGDLWGWACAKNNVRYFSFRNHVNYDLMCKIQAWNFVCSMINIGAWVASASVMAFSAYRLGWLRRKGRVPEAKEVEVATPEKVNDSNV